MMLGGEAVFSNVVPVSLRAVIPTQYVPVSQPTPSDMMTNGSSTTARIVNFTIEVYLVSNPSRMGRKVNY